MIFIYYVKSKNSDMKFSTDVWKTIVSSDFNKQTCGTEYQYT